MARGITGAARATSGERSTNASGVMAPMVRSPPGPAAMRACSWPSLRRLTRRVGRKTPAFIISMSAVPPAIGRTDESSGSSSCDGLAQRARLKQLERRHVVLSDFCEGSAQPLRELPLHLLGLGAQHRLAQAAELAGQRGVDLIAHLGSPIFVREPRRRARGEPPDDAERRAFDLGLDLARRLHPHHLDRDVELELEVRDLGLQHRGVMVRIDLVELLHALDAGGKEARVAHFREHLLACRVDHDLAGEFHRLGPRFLRAFNVSAMRSAARRAGKDGICRPRSDTRPSSCGRQKQERRRRPTGESPLMIRLRVVVPFENAGRERK